MEFNIYELLGKKPSAKQSTSLAKWMKAKGIVPEKRMTSLDAYPLNHYPRDLFEEAKKMMSEAGLLEETPTSTSKPEVKPVEPDGFVASEYQKAIFDFVRDGEGSAVVSAVAGSGKTTTIVKACELIPKTHNAVFLAFNKTIADELKKRLPKGVPAFTVHGFGYKAIKMSDRFASFDKDKMKNILLYDLFVKKGEDFFRALELSHHLKSFGFGVDEKDDLPILRNCVNEFVPEASDRAIELAQDACLLSHKKTNEIDYNDMVLMPVLYPEKYKFPFYDFIVVDEVQDLSPIQIQMLKHVSVKRVIGVGDEKQSIYGFRGADSEAMKKFEIMFSCARLPLSITYRCPKLVVREAKKYVPHIEALPEADFGSVQDISELLPEMLKPKDMVLSRFSAPLFQMAYSLVFKKSIVIQGKNLSEEIERFFTRSKLEYTSHLPDYIEEQRNKILKRIMASDEPSEAAIDRTNDRYDCYKMIVSMSKKRTVLELIDEVKEMFKVKGDPIYLSTVHRAKGLEADRVFFMRDGKLEDLLKKGASRWRIEEERNIRYVAVTRAKKLLFFFNRFTSPVDKPKTILRRRSSDETKSTP